jgi:DNA-binding transcriptional ArsR family regulator
MLFSMQIPHPIPASLADLIAQRFRVMGEPMRIRLLDALRGGELSVRELAEATKTSQQNVSKHLGVLHAAGIVRRHKDGNRVLYEIADQTVFDLCEHVCGGLQRQVEELAGLIEVSR